MKTLMVINKNCSDIKTVLDIGARNGSSSQFLRDRGCKVKAVDPKPLSDLVEVGKLGDDLGSHDLVMARLVLHLVPQDLNEALNILWSHVESNGYLYFTNFDEKDDWFKKSATDWLKDKNVIVNKLRTWEGKKYDGSTKQWFVNEYLIKKD